MGRVLDCRRQVELCSPRDLPCQKFRLRATSTSSLSPQGCRITALESNLVEFMVLIPISVEFPGQTQDARSVLSCSSLYHMMPEHLPDLLRIVWVALFLCKRCGSSKLVRLCSFDNTKALPGLRWHVGDLPWSCLPICQISSSFGTPHLSSQTSNVHCPPTPPPRLQNI